MVRRRSSVLSTLKGLESKWKVGRKVYHFYFDRSEYRWIFQGTAEIDTISKTTARLTNGQVVSMANGNAIIDGNLNLLSYYSLSNKAPKTTPFTNNF
jgi:hypothetical protein